MYNIRGYLDHNEIIGTENEIKIDESLILSDEKFKEKLGEKPGQQWPQNWAQQAVLPEQYRP